MEANSLGSVREKVERNLRKLEVGVNCEKKINDTKTIP